MLWSGISLLVGISVLLTAFIYLDVRASLRSELKRGASAAQRIDFTRANASGLPSDRAEIITVIGPTSTALARERLTQFLDQNPEFLSAAMT
jgi:hypothetical protein